MEGSRWFFDTKRMTLEYKRNFSMADLKFRIDFSQQQLTMKGNTMNQRTNFFEALQANVIVIDSDIVGAARLLWNTRVSELGWHAKITSLTFQSPRTFQETKDVMINLIKEEAGGKNMIRNLYDHDERGILFFDNEWLTDRIGPSSVTGIGEKYPERYVPKTLIELGSTMSEDGIFRVTLHHAESMFDTGSEHLAESFKKTVIDTLDFTDTPVRVRIISANPDGSTRSTTGTIDKHRVGHDAFYPYLPVSLEEYIQAFYEDEASVLFIYGPPGTGKSTFIRTAIAQLGVDALISNDEAAIESGVIFEQNFGNKPYLIALEDADKLVMSREKGNAFMSRLLNSTDGICKARAKVIISTNLPTIDRVDEALIRPGRTFDIQHFRRLDRVEAGPVLDLLKIERDHLDGRGEWSLAELSELRKKETQFFSARTKASKKFGFGFTAV